MALKWKKTDLRTLAQKKIDMANDACEATIHAGVDVELTEGTEHFSFEDKDQINIDSMMNAVQMGATKYAYHKDSGDTVSDCIMYSAADIVNGYSEESLADVIYKYGEERYSRRIARAIAEKREEGAIETSSQLADIIKASVPKEYRYGRIHPATRTFQALRIEVNKELDRITPALENAIRVLKKGGRIAVITFHSLEDRKVKWFFKDEAGKENPRIRILTKKPIIPSEEEEKENPPSRSAKLRVVERI